MSIQLENKDIINLAHIYAKLKEPDCSKHERMIEKHLKICEKIYNLGYKDNTIKAFTFLRLCPVLAKITSNAIELIDEGKKTVLEVISNEEIKLAVTDVVNLTKVIEVEGEYTKNQFIVHTAYQICKECRKNKRLAKLFEKDEFASDMPSKLLYSKDKFDDNVRELKEKAKEGQQANKQKIIDIDVSCSTYRVEIKNNEYKISRLKNKIQECEEKIEINQRNIDQGEEKIQSIKDENKMLRQFIMDNNSLEISK